MYEGSVQAAMDLAGAHVLSGDYMPQAPHPSPASPLPPDIEPVQPPQSGLAKLIAFIVSLFPRRK